MTNDLFKKKERPQNKKASYWLSKEVLDKLAKASEKHNLSKSEIIRRLVLAMKV